MLDKLKSLYECKKSKAFRGSIFQQNRFSPSLFATMAFVILNVLLMNFSIGFATEGIGPISKRSADDIKGAVDEHIDAAKKYARLAKQESIKSLAPHRGAAIIW